MPKSRKNVLPLITVAQENHNFELASKSKLYVFDYTETSLHEGAVNSVEELAAYKESPNITWINVIGSHDSVTLEQCGKCFSLHPLTLEDIMASNQRPKIEDLGDYILMIVKMITYDSSTKTITAEQVSFVLAANHLITFQEYEGDVFDPVRNRIRKGLGQIRKYGVDYLEYALLDAIVDQYFTVLEKVGERVASLEDDLITDPSPSILLELQSLKSDLIFLRKSVWPFREIIGHMERSDTPLIKIAKGIYFRDLYDHTIQVIENLETDRDMLNGMLDIYLTSLSNRMNEIMKVLTVISTIFIPVTFITGLYGMNFEFMPELQIPLAYPILLVIIITVIGMMVAYFKRREWL